MKKRLIAMLLSAVMLGAATPTVIAAEDAVLLPILSPTDVFQDEKVGSLYRAVDAVCADRAVISALPDRTQNTAMLYYYPWTPDYEFAFENDQLFRLQEVYVRDALGSSMDVTVGYRYGAALSEEAILAVADSFFDDSYTVAVIENAEMQLMRCTVQDPLCRQETYELAKDFYTALTQTYTVWNFDYVQCLIRRHRIYCYGPCYSLTTYPNAVEDLTAFAAEYATDWSVRSVGGYAQLTPATNVDDGGNLDMAKLIYDTIGYEMYVKPFGNPETEQLNCMDIRTEMTATIDRYATNLNDYTLITDNVDFLALPEGSEGFPLYVSDAVFSDQVGYRYDSPDSTQGKQYYSAYYANENVLIDKASYHQIVVDCTQINNYDGDASADLALYEGIVNSIFDDTYIIQHDAVNIIPYCHHLNILDPLLREDTEEKAQQLCEALSEYYNFRTVNYYENCNTCDRISPSQETCLPWSFVSYRYEAFPNAYADLQGFVEAYAPDWYLQEFVRENDEGIWEAVGVFLCPKNGTSIRPYGEPSEQLAMAKQIYDVLGYRVAATVASTQFISYGEEHDTAAAVIAAHSGDTDFNGRVDSADAVNVLRSYVEISLLESAAPSLPYLRRMAGDMDQNGTLTPDDAIVILKQYASDLGT